MAENSKIQWTDHTFNPWRGCTKVSPGCDLCYAETMSKRNQSVLGVWGKYGSRVIASDAMWKEPVKWNREARDGVCPECKGRTFQKDEVTLENHSCVTCDGKGRINPYRLKVFCASLADVFEGHDTMPEDSWQTVEDARVRLFTLIDATPNLDWLLLTKRPELVMPWFEERKWPDIYIPNNVWLGTTVENQKYADIRILELLQVPAAVRFLSVEPMLGAVDFMNADGDGWRGGMTGAIHWVIVGCESGKDRRPMNLEWAESIVDQCKAAGVPVFVKQLEINGKVTGDIEQFPRALQVREFPKIKSRNEQ